MKMVKTFSLIILVAGYVYAGVNHFWHPGTYIRIIPGYIPFPIFMNYLSGAFEILFGFLLAFTATRNIGAWGIFVLLIAFIPVHIQMIIDAPFNLSAFKVTPLIAWLRLALQPLLMLWVWWYVIPAGHVTSPGKNYL